MNTTTRQHDWFTVLGSIRPIVGPWHGEDAAESALDRLAARMGADWGTFAATNSLRVAGPFCSRREALAADISDYPDHLCDHGELA